MVRLTHEAIDLSALQATADGDGALCLFVGTVRNENAGRDVLRLEYEAYEPLVVSEGALQPPLDATDDGPVCSLDEEDGAEAPEGKPGQQSEERSHQPSQSLPPQAV